MQVDEPAHDLARGPFHEPPGLAVDARDAEEPVQGQAYRGHEQDGRDPAESGPRVPLVQEGVPRAVKPEGVHDRHEEDDDHRIRDDDEKGDRKQGEQDGYVEHEGVGREALGLLPAPWPREPRGRRRGRLILPVCAVAEPPRAGAFALRPFPWPGSAPS